eukprot:6203574-Pleurochrysis_carterae.AAC.5
MASALAACLRGQDFKTRMPRRASGLGTGGAPSMKPWGSISTVDAGASGCAAQKSMATAAPRLVPESTMGRPPHTVCQNAYRCSRFVRMLTSRTFDVELKPHPTRSTAYASMPCSSRRGIRRRYSIQEESKPCKNTTGGLLLRGTFVCKYVHSTGPMETSSGSFKSCVLIERAASKAAGSVTSSIPMTGKLSLNRDPAKRDALPISPCRNTRPAL